MKYMMISVTLILSIISHAMEPEKIQLNRGILIAIEGIDGSGKSTLAKSLSTALQKTYTHVKLTQNPYNAAICQLIQTQTPPFDPIAESFLFTADLRDHFCKIIEPNLKENHIVISDRLADSSLTYQGYGRGLDKSTIKLNNQLAMQNITPNLTIFIKVPVKVALKRIKKRNETLLEKVAAGFEEIYEQYLDSAKFKLEYTKEAQKFYIKTLESTRKTSLTSYTKKFNLTQLDPTEFDTVPAKHVKLITVDGTQTENEVANKTIAVVSEWIKRNNY